jgi:hypothetical protein
LHITLYSHGYIVFSFVTNLQMLSDWWPWFQTSFHQRQEINQEDTFT